MPSTVTSNPSDAHATSSYFPHPYHTAHPTFVNSGSRASSDSAAPAPEQSLHQYVSQHLYVMNSETKLPPVHRSLYSGRPHLDTPRPYSSSNSRHTRSLTVYSSSSESSVECDMATGSVSPGSPPELSSSWSSNKSSTIRSSSHNGGIEENMANYEDISLADPRRMTPTSPLDRPNKPRSLLRTTTAPVTAQLGKKMPHSPTNLVPMKNELRSGVSISTNLRNLSGPRPPIRSNPSPSSSPTLAVPPRQSRRKNDFVSHSRPHGPPHRSVTSPIVRPKSDTGPFLPMKRTTSQAGTGRRRSAKELEAEFDKLNDMDEDEVPEDAIITNIPISPCRPSSRSHSASPERGLPSPNSPVAMDFGRARSWDFAMSGLNAEIRHLTLKLENHKDSQSRRNSAELTTPSPTSSSPPRPSLHPSKSTTFALPPVQRPNPLVDPLPISKEKEKHLTRTRPSWLPPKSKTEEKKHLKEYKRMMDAFAESEKRKSAEAESIGSGRSSKEKERDENLRVWRSILGDWHTAVHDPKNRERWWNGVPPALRGQVWARAIGNDLHLTVSSFKAALNRARTISERIVAATPPPTRTPHARSASLSETKTDVRARRSLAAMEKDIEAGAFPRLGLFQKGQARHENLKDLLMAYASYREDTGHVRGTAGIAALLLLQHMPAPASSAKCDSPDTHKRDSGYSSKEDREREVSEAATAGAFIALANLLNRPLSLAFCINDSSSKDRTIRHVEKAIKIKSPRLHEHFSALMSRSRSTPDFNSLQQSSGDATPILRDIVNSLAQSLMTSVLTASEAARFFDVLVFEGDGVVVRAIVGILGRCEGSLYGTQEEINRVLGWQSTGAPMGRGEDDWVRWVKWAGREDAAPPR